VRLTARRPLRPSRPTDDANDPQRVVPVRPGAQVAARVGLWGLVVLGAFGGLIGMVRPSARPEARATEASESATLPPEMAGFAELAVKTWLEATGGDDAEVEAMFAANPSTSAADGGRRRVADTSTVGARRIGDGYWAVTVAAPVSEMVSERWRDAGTWYLEVGVMAGSDGSLVATAEPAIVPAPTEPEEAPRPAGGSLGVPSGDDEAMAAAVEGFLSSLVAGSGDVSRYLAPDVEIAPVTPAPFTQVSLLRWSVTELDGGEVRVRLTARGVSASGVPRSLSYELELAERAGRWEVLSLSGAPTMEDAEDAAEETTTTSTTAPASTTTVSISSSPGA
jgi:hypothetical protein